MKAFHTLSRSVRQSVALEARLARQQALDAREAERAEAGRPSRRPGAAEISRRASAVRSAVTRVIWDEAEDDDSATWLEDALNEELGGACLRDDFCAETLDDHIVRLCQGLGLSEAAARRWRDLPDAQAPDPEDDDPPGATNAAAPEPQAQSSA